MEGGSERGPDRALAGDALRVRDSQKIEVLENCQKHWENAKGKLENSYNSNEHTRRLGLHWLPVLAAINSWLIGQDPC